jgi:hypothetical protein
MKGDVDLVFFGLVCAALLWLTTLWLATHCRLRQCHRVKVGFGIMTILLLFAPIGGLPLWNWAFSFCPNPSLPLLGAICAALWQRLRGNAIFKPADWSAIWCFGGIAGTVLYLHPIVLPSLDLYYWGWHPEVAVWSIAVPALIVVAMGNRLGVLFLAALVAYGLGALESHNSWDYVIDPLYWLTSLGFGVARGVRSITSWRRRRGAASTFSAAPLAAVTAQRDAWKAGLCASRET